MGIPRIRDRILHELENAQYIPVKKLYLLVTSNPTKKKYTNFVGILKDLVKEKIIKEIYTDYFNRIVYKVSEE